MKQASYSLAIIALLISCISLGDPIQDAILTEAKSQLRWPPNQPTQEHVCCLCTEDARSYFALAQKGYHNIMLHPYPHTTGHIVLFPSSHARDITELSPKQLVEHIMLIRSCMAILQQTLHPHGFSISMNMGQAIGKKVEHLHTDIIPRMHDDRATVHLARKMELIQCNTQEIYEFLAYPFQRLIGYNRANYTTDYRPLSDLFTTQAEVIDAPWRTGIFKKKYAKKAPVQKCMCHFFEELRPCFHCEELCPCFFCKELNDNQDEKYYILERTAHTAIYLNPHPYKTGHLLLIPYSHVRNIMQLSDEALIDLAFAIRKGVSILKKTLSPHGFNVTMNVEKAGGASMPDHVHAQIIPYWDFSKLPNLPSQEEPTCDLRRVYNYLLPHFKN